MVAGRIDNGAPLKIAATNGKVVDGDWPDCVIRHSAGVQVGVEVTEFVDQNAVEMCKRGKNVYREWSDQDVREKLEQILSSKDRKAHHGNLTPN